jgi:hypothetical protein
MQGILEHCGSFILQFSAVNGDCSSRFARGAAIGVRFRKRTEFSLPLPTLRLDHGSDQPCSATFSVVNIWSVKLIIYC